MPVAKDVDTWATRGEAAQELSVILGEAISVNTLMGWTRQPDCPIPHGRGPIPKDPLILWAQTQRTAGRRSNATGEESDLRVRLLEEQVRNLEGKNQKLFAESINAEEARQGIVRAVEEFRRELTQELPSAAWAASQGKPVEEGVALIRDLITAALNRFAEQAQRVAP